MTDISLKTKTYAFFSDVSDINPKSEQLLNQISTQRRKRVERFISEEAKKQSIGVELLLNLAVKALNLSDSFPIEYEYLKSGKPVSCDNSFYFSLAHSGNIAACAISDSPVGIDVEYPKLISTRIIDKILSKPEKGELFDLRDKMLCNAYLVKRWVVKEAYLKLTGEGLGFPMCKISLSKNMVIGADGNPLAYVSQKYLHEMPCYTAICSKLEKEVVFSIETMKLS